MLSGQAPGRMVSLFFFFFFFFTPFFSSLAMVSDPLVTTSEPSSLSLLSDAAAESRLSCDLDSVMLCSIQLTVMMLIM
jgi:hypothetical protein